MVIEMPAQIEAGLTQEVAALNLALGLYASGEVTLEGGAKVARMSQSAFLKELGKRRIPFHYGIEEFDEDLATIQRKKAQ